MFATLNTDSKFAMPIAQLSPDQFIARIHAARPPILYLWEQTLDTDEEIQERVEDAGMEMDGEFARAVHRAAEGLRQHEGTITRIFVEAVVGGVYHLTYSEADWITRFEEEVQIEVARYSEDMEQQRVRELAQANAELRRLATALVADSAFHTGRVSFAKRRFLASELFPQAGDRVLDAAVELAENMAWLSDARDRA